MANADELIAQAAAADTTDQLDAIQAASSDPGVNQAVQNRREDLRQRSTTTPAAQQAERAELGPNMTTEPAKPAQHYYLATDGKTRINAWGEEKGSPEDKKRFS